MKGKAFSDRLFALCRAGKPVEAGFSFAGEEVELRFLGSDRLRTFFTKAIAHREQAVRAPSLRVWVVDRASSGIMLPAPTWDWSERDGFGNLTAFPSEGYFANFQQESNTFTLLDRRRGRAVVWMNDLRTLPEWERSFPLRTVLYEWFKDGPSLFLHAGAVGTFSGGALLTGRSGSGKSTAALACLDGPLRYAGDDFVAVNTETMRVHSLYNVAKLERSQVRYFPALEPLLYNRSTAPQEKAQLFVRDHFPERIIGSFPLKAILLPHFTGRTFTTTRTATDGEALRALAPSTIALLKAPPGYLARIRTLVERVPCHWLLTGTDLAHIPKAIQSCLAAVPTTQPVES